MFDLTGKAAAASGRMLQADNDTIADQSVCVRTSFGTHFGSAISQGAGSSKCRFSGRHFSPMAAVRYQGN
jgi:hypothetical protein